MKQEWISHNEDDTVDIAKKVADIITYPSVICLNGDLGAGKTAFSRALIRHLIGDDNAIVPSPTYNLVQTYDDDTIWHFDLYRLDDPQDLYDIGWEEALTAKLCLIEWPIRLGRLLPRKRIDIDIKVEKNDSRTIHLSFLGG